MEVKDGLAGAAPDVDRDAVVLQAGRYGRLGDELEHPLRLLGAELADVAERVDVPLWDDEEVHVGLRVDVLDRDEAVALGDMRSLGIELAEQAVVAIRRQAGPPA